MNLLIQETLRTASMKYTKGKKEVTLEMLMSSMVKSLDPIVLNSFSK